MLGRIPQNRLYQLGLNILKMFPEPNTTGLNFNLRTVAPEDKRIDAAADGARRLPGVVASCGYRHGLQARSPPSKPVPGTIPGFNDNFQKLNSRHRAVGDRRLHAEFVDHSGSNLGDERHQPAQSAVPQRGHEPVHCRACATFRCCSRTRVSCPPDSWDKLHHREDRYAVLRERRGADAARVRVGQPR